PIIQDPGHALRGFLQEAQLELDFPIDGLHGLERTHDVPDPGRGDSPGERLEVLPAMVGEEVRPHLAWNPEVALEVVGYVLSFQRRGGRVLVDVCDAGNIPVLRGRGGP